MEDERKNLINIFKALSNQARLDIVIGLVSSKECNVTKMVENLHIPQPNVSQHLNVLKKAGIIKGYRKGNQICYKIINETVKKLVKAIE